MSRKDWKRPESFEAPEGKRRIAIELAYDGRAYCGWQSQTDGNSVQDEIIKAVERLTNQTDIQVCGSGRTDSGVHAMGQVAHIEIGNCTIPCIAFNMGLNSFLPKTIRIHRAWEAGRYFHARYSAMAREYRYFCTDDYSTYPFKKGLITYLRRIPDLSLLNDYAKILIGTHNFTTFAGSEDQCPSKVRDIYESCFFELKSEYGERVLCYKICGNAFLYHMVRSLTGTMLEMAQKNRTASEFMDVLESKNRQLCGKTAPSDGLYLWRVSYDKDEYQWFEEKYGQS